MVDATLSRGTTSIAIPLLADSGGTPLIARDLGKPNLRLQTNGRVDPRSSDFWAGMQNFQIFGQFTGSNAYADAIVLADLIKSGSARKTLLNVPIDVYDTDIQVVPMAEQDQALTLTYPPGRRNWVEVKLGLTRVSQVFGDGGLTADSPLSSLTGQNIEITDGTDTVELTTDIEIERTVGRPNSTARGKAPGDYPTYIEQRKSSYDAFELGLEFQTETTAKTNTLISMFEQQLERNTLTLDFRGNFLYGAFDVVPDGSNALRQVEPAAEEGTQLIPKITLRVVNND